MLPLSIQYSLASKCMNGEYMARPRGNYKERFLNRIVKMDSGCHEWQGQVKRDGYGRFCYQAKTIPAHRAAFLIFKGEIPEGLFVLHTCDNRICVNPAHLYLGTSQDNAQDMVKRGRNWGRRKPTNEQVEWILIRHRSGDTQTQIAIDTGLHQTTVSRIVHGKNAYARKLMN